jgi:hypothetical protein
MTREIGCSPPRWALRGYDDLGVQIEIRMNLTILEFESFWNFRSLMLLRDHTNRDASNCKDKTRL